MQQMLNTDFRPVSGENTKELDADRGFAAFLERTRDEPVYVILGVQGAGTNLLGRLLVRVFNFSLMRDRSLVFNAAARLGPHPTTESIAREIRTIKKHIFPSAWTRRMSKYAIRDNEPFAGLAPHLRPEAVRSGADLARLVYSYRAWSLGTTRMAIKSDDIWETIDAMEEVLPNRRIVLITRDPRDNLVSVGGKGFGPIEPLCAARYVKQRLARYAAEYRRAGSQAFHVRFDTLVSSTRTFVDAFGRHYGLQPVVDPDEVLRSFTIRPNKVAKWRVLPPEQLSWCEGILQPELVEFGYPLASASPRLPGRSVMIAATARDTVRRIPQKIRSMVERIKR